MRVAIPTIVIRSSLPLLVALVALRAPAVAAPPTPSGLDRLFTSGCGMPEPLIDPTDGMWAQVTLEPGGVDRTLSVGTLDGAGWVALRTPGPLRISGPADGLVLAQHQSGTRTPVDLVDVRGGTIRRLADRPSPLAGMTIHPSGCAWLWLEPEGERWTLWGRSFDDADAPAVRLSDPLPARDPDVMVSLDGLRVAVDATDDARPAWIVDLVDGSATHVHLPSGAQLLPVLGRRFVPVLAGTTPEGAGFPLVSIDPSTGRTRTLVEDGAPPVRPAAGIDPPVYAWRENVDGTPVLRLYGVWADRSVPLPEGAGSLVIDGPEQGVDAPGWLPVFPGGAAYAGTQQEQSGPRLMVSSDTGETVSLPPITLAGEPPAPSPSPTPQPFPYPIVPRPADVPTGPRFEPRGRPDATTTRHGIRLRLWLSSSSVAPGEWVQAAVRTTNLGRDAAWQWSGECRTSGTFAAVELRDTIPRGRPQTGNAAELKGRITRRSTRPWFPAWRYRRELDASVMALAECGILPGLLKLKPGKSKVEHFAWYGGSNVGGGRFWQPPYPGTVPVTVEWPFVSRGERPHGSSRSIQIAPIRVSLPLTITGQGPGTRSLDELVDRALADPDWRAWVDADPTRARWRMIDTILWPGPDYADRAVLIGDLDRFGRPNGILDIELDQRRPDAPSEDRGFILLDPWTGEVLEVILPTWARPSPIAP